MKSIRWKLVEWLVVVTLFSSHTSLAAPSIFEPASNGEMVTGTPKAPIVKQLTDNKSLLNWLKNLNPDVQAAYAQVVQSQENLQQSQVLPNPLLDFTLSNIPIGTTNPAGLSFDKTSY